MRRIVLQLLPLVLVACAPDSESTAGVGPAPFRNGELVLDGPAAIARLDGALFRVRAVTEGGDEIVLLIDTGAGMSCFDGGRARELGLPTYPVTNPIEVQGANGKQELWSEIVRPGPLDLGGARLEGEDFLLADLTVFSFPFDGILGWDLLADCPVLFEPEAVHLIGRGADEVAIVDYLGVCGLGLEQWEKLDMLTGRDAPLLDFEFEDGVHTEVLIDTGSVSSGLPEAAIRAQGLHPVGAKQMQSVTGWAEESLYAFEKFGLGSHAFAVHVTGNLKGRGQLGLDILERLAFVVDGPGNALWISPLDDGKRRGGVLEPAR